MLAWAMNWMFFDIDNKHNIHALTRSFYYSLSLLTKLIIAIGYNFAMSFVVTGLTLAGAALPQVVVASDGNAPSSDLTPEFADISLNPLPHYLRWYFAAGLASGSSAMSLSVFDLNLLRFTPTFA